MHDFNYHVKSPLNYTGNKYRILSQIKPHFPQHINTMVDLFCGGATVGLNTPCQNVIFIDSNPYVINLLQYLSFCNFETLLAQLERLINHYHLSYSANRSYSYFFNQQEQNINRNNGLKEFNRQGYYLLRDNYNAIADKTTEHANLLLYLLIVYGFNNDIRFSNDQRFNLPAGKTDLNRNNIRKLREYIDRVQSINAKFVCGDFRQDYIHNKIFNADFIYMDPPYLITDAVYNESGKWSTIVEQDLLQMIDELIAQKKRFALSNVLAKNDHINMPLSKWLQVHKDDTQVIDINYHYRGAYYNKKERVGEREVLIIPKYNA